MKGSWLAAALLVLSALGVHVTQRSLSSSFHELKANSDVYPLPSPEQTVVLSLGYRAALADLIYGQVLVSYGLHFQERRLFEFVGNYLRTINELDPKFREPYLFADTLLVLQPKPPPLKNYRAAREILLRGTRERPYDTRLWISAGQYLAYLGRPFIQDPKEKQQWKVEGARLLARGCELSSSDENLPYQCITAAGILNKTGQHEANIKFLRRFLAVTDDPEIRKTAIAMLRKELEREGLATSELRSKRLDEKLSTRRGFVSKDMALVLDPWFDPVDCVTGENSRRRRCVTSWRDWGEESYDDSLW